ncbi:MAG: ATP-binding protein [Oscillospiraceae bacterium]|nr:ATP-binding protein [Oscillospiraceae bacterium]
MNILDVAENSISAGASVVNIELDYRDDGTLLLTIEDNGAGMGEDAVKSVTSPFYTSRTTRKVGLGVPFLKMAAEMTGGEFLIESEPGKGTLVTAQFDSGHIDMIPLGDMGSTMSLLVSCNPTMDFTSTVNCKGQSFTFDSAQIKQILDGVPIESPEVAVFIKEFIEENLSPLLR